MEQKIRECIDDVIWDASEPCVYALLEAVIDKHVRHMINPYHLIHRIRAWMNEREKYHKEISESILKIHAYFRKHHIDVARVLVLYNHHNKIHSRYSLAEFWMTHFMKI